MQHFRARRQKSGTTYYYFDAGGKPRKEIPLGKDYVAAVRKWTQLMAESAPVVVTFADLADKYEREVIPLKAKSTQTLQRFDLKALREFFCTPSPAPLDQIKPSHIHKLLQWKKGQPTTANRLKRQFSHMFNMARAWGFTDATNPVTGVKGFSLAKRENYITDAIFRAVWDVAPAPLRDAMDLAYLTGQRPGDVLRMTERDMVDGMLLVEQGKTGAKLRIRIEGKLAELMARIKARKDGYKVWSASLAVNTRGMPLTANTLRNLFDAARASASTAHPALAAEIKAMRFYDLRAKAADDVSDEYGEQAAANLLGHDSVTTTQRHYLRKGRAVGPTK